MAQDILITPKATTPTIAYTGNGGGAATVTQKVLSDSRIQFDDGGAVIFEINPVTNQASATNLLATSATATYFIGDGSNLTNVTAEWDGSHTGAADINGNLSVTGNVNVTGNTILDAVTGTGLTVQGNAAVTGTLNVTGNTTLAAVTGTTGTFTGAVNMDSTLRVDGTTNMTTVNAGAVTASGTLTAQGNAAVTGTLNVTGNTTLAAVTGTTGQFTGAVNMDSTLRVDGTTNMQTVNAGALSLSGNITATGRTLTIGAVTATTGQFTGAVNMDSTLRVDGTTNMTTVNTGALNVSGAINATSQTLTVDVVNAAGNVSANAFYGDGSNLTNIAATAIDHGALAGLADDDHTQYAIKSPSTAARNTIQPTADVAALTLQAGLSNTGNLLDIKDSTTASKLTVNISGDLSSAGDINILGDLKAASKSFLIDHPDPAKTGWKLQYTCLEGPENGVYTRGRANGLVVDLPDHWPHLVHQDSITVHLTPIGLSHPVVRVSDVKDNKIFVEGAGPDDLVDFFYIAYATRKDIPMLVVEHAPEGDA